MKDFLIIYAATLLIGSLILSFSFPYGKKDIMIKIPLFLSICLCTFGMVDAKKRVSLYKVLIQTYYQVANLYLVISRQIYDMQKIRVIVISYWMLCCIMSKYYRGYNG